MGGNSWAPIACEVCWKAKRKYVSGSHVYAGRTYCQIHYLMAAKGFVECSGCLGTGWSLPHGQHDPRGKVTCSLCKGAKVLESLDKDGIDK